MKVLIARSIAWTFVGIYIVLSAMGLYLQALTNTTPGNIPIPILAYLIAVIFVGIWPVIGAKIISHHPNHPVGWLLFATFPVIAIVMFAIGYASIATSQIQALLPIPGAILFWLKDPGLPIAIVTLTLMFLLYPTGKLLSSRWWIVALICIGSGLVVIALLMVKPGPLSLFPSLENRDAVSYAIWDRLEPLFLFMITILALCNLTAVVSLYLRLRQAFGDEAQQVKWLILPASVYWIGIATNYLYEFNPIEIFQVIGVILHLISVPAIVIAVAFAIFKYRLYDIDLIINRTLVYGALTASVVGIYVVVVGTLGIFFQTQGNQIIALIATGLVAVFFQPMRRYLQRGVNRLIYGQRDDPLGTLSQLGRRLEAAITPDDVLPTLVETISQTLKLPYVAISLRSANKFKVAAHFGKYIEGTIKIPLIYQGETVGQLIAGPRQPGESFSQTDKDLLSNIAHQAGPAAYVVQLTNELRHSRVRLVTAREEERRRLRRDLHDGLGPVLASQGLKMAAVGKLLQENPAKSMQLLDDLIAQNENIMIEVRRLVYEMRPAALDDLGLVGAVRDYAAGIKNDVKDHPNLKIEVKEPYTGFPTLPAAIEVAAYRIATEGLTNISHHAGAHHAEVSFTLNSTNGTRNLNLKILDDGIGFPESRRSGIGMISMRERAEEVGGNLLIESSPGQGTCVIADLPLVNVK